MTAFVSLPAVKLDTRRVRSMQRSSSSAASALRMSASGDDAQRKSRQQRLAQGVASIAAAFALAFSPAVPSMQGDVAPSVALAKTGGGTFRSASGRVNKDPESLLRWGLPIDNKEVRELQTDLEDITYDIRAAKWSNIENDVRRASGVLKNRRDRILSAVSDGKKPDAEKLLGTIDTKLDGLSEKVGERNGEEVISAQRDVLRDVGAVEQLMIDEFPFKVPEQYKDLPQLKGRAVVSMKLKKANNEKFDIEGTLYNEGKITLVLDGFTAPITAGNFLDLVRKGFYTDMEIIRSDGFVIQSGDPAGDADGYIDPKTREIRRVPLEIFAAGDSEPTYGVTLEDDGRGTQPVVLPFTSYGTLAMAREEFTPDSGSSQFFWFLFEPDLTPAGRNLIDGRYAVFGYAVDGQYFLRDLKAGDRIVEAKVESGLENLQAAKDTSEYKSAQLERG